METNSADEQDLAKALDGVDEAVAGLSSPVAPVSPVTPPSSGGLSFEETATPGLEPVVLPGSPVAPASTDESSILPPTPSIMSSAPAADEPTFGSSDSSAPAPSSELESIKKDALIELRPLVDKLTVGAEEKFDTYLLLIRSTDDDTLIAPAHEAAKAITDETRRAEALLDIIKEIDYLSQPKKAAA